MISKDKKMVLELFSEGRKYYKLMDFDRAKTYFDDALKIDSEDGPSKEYSKRCKFYLENPPDDDWDGVHTMTTK